MITGKGANAMYWGGILIVVLVTLGVIFLSWVGKPIPLELGVILSAALGFVFGTHVQPPNVEKMDVSTKERDDERL